MRKHLLIKAFFHMPLKWRELYEKAEGKGIVTQNGKKCYKVELTHKSGVTQIYYLDTDTMMPVMVEDVMLGIMSSRVVPVEIFLDNYREVDGILYPFRRTYNVAGNTVSIMEFESIEHNLDLPSDQFDLPLKVKEKLENK